MSEPQNRDKTGRFVPGNTSNPGGRPKGLARKIRAEVGDDAEEIVCFMLMILRDQKASYKERMQAATWLADRGYGKPTQSLELTGEIRIDVQAFTDEELDTLQALLEKGVRAGVSLPPTR